MNILINCSNLKAGGGIQVADSVCGLLNEFHNHFFIVVLSSKMECTKSRIEGYTNVKEVYTYDVKNNLQTLVFGRDSFLDGCVKIHSIDAVLTIFGPSRWNPKVAHLSGWAIPHPLLPDSPYFTMLPPAERLLVKLKCLLWRYMFGRSTDFFWTENPFTTDRVKSLFPKKTVFSVTNYYNQVFDTPYKWTHAISLPSFDGTTLLTITANYPHKNLKLLVESAELLRENHPDFNFRFVLTVDEGDLVIPEVVKNNFVLIGKVDVVECPNLYQQSDIMILPSLLECFSATYPEAMKMGVPIVTTDLDFAKGLCGNAACYYSAVNAEDAAVAIYKVATNKEYAKQLVDNGKKQLLTYDNYEQRVDKLIGILEKIVGEK